MKTTRRSLLSWLIGAPVVALPLATASAVPSSFMIDARGASDEAIARLREQMDRDREEFHERVIDAVRLAKKARQL